MTSLEDMKCKIGLHHWGEWEYFTSSDTEMPESCQERRTCTCCKATEVREGEEHQWGEWHCISEGDCRTTRSCKRCGAEEKGTAAHRWSQWEARGPRSCERRRFCTTCKGSEVREDHSWGGWTAEEERACTRCEVKEHNVAKFHLLMEPGHCDVCNRQVGVGEAYLVPVEIFYASEKYRDHLANGPDSFAINIAGGIDNFMMECMSTDQTEHSIVCKRCLRLFE